jgi:sugar/nucleoside kinase (ribokinase family)
MKKIVVVGEILVEIMADHPGEGFLETIALTGPFPSGAPAIYIDQVAKMGQPCTIISSVGKDDFGRVNLDRLERDGVDTSGIAIDSERPTGTAFVRYREDGGRDFVFNIRHSACGRVPTLEVAQRLLDTADHLHVMGSSLSSPEFIEVNLTAARSLKERGGTVSFDPNLRKEILDSPGMREAMIKILAVTDVFLPSGEELFLLTQSTTAEGAVSELLGQGIDVIVHKQGADGARYYDRTGNHFAPGFAVREVDPTGAGDCFGGAFTTLWLRGEAPDKALRYANAAGALAVTQRGPMEGSTSLQDLEAFLQAQTNP